jgi:hypothetical protein
MLKTKKIRNNNKLSREEYTKILREYHKDKLNKFGENIKFIPKFAFYRKGSTIKDGKVLQFFENELSTPVDIYTELIDKNGNPEDPERTLYKIKHNPYFREEYLSETKIDKKKEEYKVYYIPFEELILVSETDDHYSIEKEGDELKWEDLTARDRIALYLRVPESNKEWINKLILKTKENGK